MRSNFFRHPNTMFAITGIILTLIAIGFGIGSALEKIGLVATLISSGVLSLIFAILTPKTDTVKDFISYFALFFGTILINEVMIAILVPLL